MVQGWLLVMLEMTFAGFGDLEGKGFPPVSHLFSCDGYWMLLTVPSTGDAEFR